MKSKEYLKQIATTEVIDCTNNDKAKKRIANIFPVCISVIEKDLERLEKLEKVIEILKGRMCVHNGYVCYDAYADIKLKDEEIDLLYEVLSYEEI